MEAVAPVQSAVRQWFAQPFAQFVGAYTHCSCGFPHVLAETPIDYYEGLWSDGEDRQAEVESMRALIQLLQETLNSSESVEVYPVWSGNEGRAPKGRVDWLSHQLVPAQMVFTEQFFYAVRAQSV